MQAAMTAAFFILNLDKAVLCNTIFLPAAQELLDYRCETLCLVRGRSFIFRDSVLMWDSPLYVTIG